MPAFSAHPKPDQNTAAYYIPDDSAAAGQEAQMICAVIPKPFAGDLKIMTNDGSLSAGRVQTVDQTLMRGGIGENRLDPTEGVADREPLVAKDPVDLRGLGMSIQQLN